jgi:homoserine kinase type II
MDMSNLWEAWSIPGPWHLSPLPGGTNKLMWRADGADGQSYVLRLSSELDRAPRLRYEAWLLQELEDQAPPFRLPVPLKAVSGDILVTFEQEQGTEALATLSPLLPGKLHDLPPERYDVVSASNAALTLAWLDTALATLSDRQAPVGYLPLPTFGELANWHPLISEPLAAVERLPATREQIRQLRSLLTEVLESVDRLYATLPQQLIHRDYDPGNLLMDHRSSQCWILSLPAEIFVSWSCVSRLAGGRSAYLALDKNGS